ncbi:hypothetical protein RB595_001913 [Gaeumannomyces hyphopodioides]
MQPDDDNSNGPPAPTPGHHSGDSSQHPSPDTILEAMTPYPGTACGEPSPQASNEPEIIPLNTPLMTQMEDVACWHPVLDSTAPAQEEYDYDVIPDHKFGLYPSPPPVPSTLTLPDQQTGEASGVADDGVTSTDFYVRASDFAATFNHVDSSWPTSTPTMSPFQQAHHQYNIGWQTQPQDTFASPQMQTSGMPAMNKHYRNASYHHQRFDTFALGSGPIQPQQARSAAPASSYSPLQYPAAVDTPALFPHSPTPDLGYSGSPTPSFSPSSCVTPRTSFRHAGGMGNNRVVPVGGNSHRFAGGNLVAGDGFANQPQQQGWQQLSGGALGSTDTAAFPSPYAESEGHRVVDASSTQRQSPTRQSSDQGESAKKETPYSKLIFQSFRDNDFKPMELQEIYDWFDKNTNKRQEDPRGRGGWMNSIRHNLSMNRAFTKEDPRESGPPQGALGGGTAGARRRKKGASPREKHATWYVTPEAVKAGGVLPTTRDRNKGRGKGGSRLCRQPQQYHQPPPYSSSSSSQNNQFGMPAAAVGPSSSIASQLRGQDHTYHHLPTSSPRPPSGRPAVGYRGPGGAGLSTHLAHQELHHQPGFDTHHSLVGGDVVHLCGPQLQLPQPSPHNYQPHTYQAQQQQQQHLLPAAPLAPRLEEGQQHYYNYMDHERRQQQRDRLATQQAPLQAGGGGGHQIGARYHGDYQQDAAAPPPPASSCYGVVPLMAPASLPANPVPGTGPSAAAPLDARAIAFESGYITPNAFVPINSENNQQQRQQQQQPQDHPTPIKVEAPSPPPLPLATGEDADAEGDADVDVAPLQRHGRPIRPGSPLARGDGESRPARERRRSHLGWSG